jgi:hypothetical protein
MRIRVFAKNPSYRPLTYSDRQQARLVGAGGPRDFGPKKRSQIEHQLTGDVKTVTSES